MDDCIKEIDEVLKKHNAELKVFFRTERVLGQELIAHTIQVVMKPKKKDEQPAE